MSTEDLEKYETEMELQLYREYRDIVRQFTYVVETERRFYLANSVDLQVREAGGEVYFELKLSDAWVWDMYRPARFVRNVRVLTFKDVNVEELDKPDLELPENPRLHLSRPAAQPSPGGPAPPSSGGARPGAVKARHRAMWASGDYPRMVETFLLPIGPRLVEASGIAPGARARRRRRHRQRVAPGRARGAQVTASDLTPELLGRRAPPGRGPGPRARVGTRRTRSTCRSRTAPSTSSCRRSGSCSRRTTRQPLTSWSACAVPAAARPAVLDAGGDARRAVPHDEALRAAAAARCAAAAAVGQRGAPDTRCSAAGWTFYDPAAGGPGDHGLRGPVRLRAALHGLLRARRSPRARTPPGTAARTSSTTPSTASATSGTGAPGSGPVREGVPARRRHPAVTLGAARQAPWTRRTRGTLGHGRAARRPRGSAGGSALERADWHAARSAFDGCPRAAETRPRRATGLAQALWFLGDVTEALALRERAFEDYVRRRPLRRRRASGRLGVAPAHDRRAYVGGAWLAGPLRSGALDGVPRVRRARLGRGRAGPPGAVRPGADRARHPGPRGRRRLRARATWRSSRVSLLGRATVSAGRRDEGLRLLEEAMAAATAGRVRNVHTLAEAYCNLIDGVHRARATGSAATEWCELVDDVRPHAPDRAAARRLPDRPCRCAGGQRSLGRGRDAPCESRWRRTRGTSRR